MGDVAHFQSVSTQVLPHPREQKTFDASFLCTTLSSKLFPGASTDSVDVHDAVEKSPKENVGKQSAEQSRGEECRAAT